MKKHSGWLLLTCILLSCSMTVLSCGKIKSKGYQVTDKSEEIVPVQTESISDDNNTSPVDIVADSIRFRNYLATGITSDVKELYIRGDSSGLPVLIAFTCGQSTADRIIRRNGMELCADKEDKGLACPGVSWWKTDIIDKVTPYKSGEEDEYWQYLWYDPVSRQALYQEFSR
jgi:hypothetical protein